MIVAFTGPHKPKASPRGTIIGACAREFGYNPPTEIRSGAAPGVDTIAYFHAVSILPLPQLHHVMVPTGEMYNQDLVLYAKQEGHKVTGIPGGYLKRDAALVTGADLLIAFPETMKEIRRSGTWTTIRYAWKRGVEVHYYPLDGKPGPVVRCT